MDSFDVDVCVIMFKFVDCLVSGVFDYDELVLVICFVVCIYGDMWVGNFMWIFDGVVFIDFVV